MLAVTAAQVPSAPPVFAAVHASQVAPQAVSQHTPSCAGQKPLAHSLSPVHASPSFLVVVHTPERQ